MTASLFGVRHDELLAVRWSDIDFQAGKFSSGAASPGRDGKTNQVRPDHVFTSQRLSPESGRFRIRRSYCPSFACGSCNALRAISCLSRTDRSTESSEQRARYGLYRAMRRVGLGRADMHSLRHSFASALIIAGAPVTEVQYLLGHSSPQTSLKVYSHWFTSTQSDSMHRLSRTLAENFGHFLDTLDRSEGSAGTDHSVEVI